ncbi:hypothetical protein RO3G_06571 [Rhizopus delemar RA 99-880]|uniref:Uncharacterized protein n=1 Tax=Rhizopus delemar (strain RA 99-880 / ATCC MYA-4621 / FGSC 9543 / NRRL 43880) TaxID=246409 RepID=I1C086_RHIO9|nr:hypothetical protein RO3G_06571 [Rhizopus delemar RA 99-880]|eukprot:EIE81866.1 hypothetical protein RO3G_06571 [Rhizopus delemar RA 99-880]
MLCASSPSIKVITCSNCIPKEVSLQQIIKYILKSYLQKGRNNDLIFTYMAVSDCVLMELALQVMGMKIIGLVGDVRKIATSIVQRNNDGNGQIIQGS